MFYRILLFACFMAAACPVAVFGQRQFPSNDREIPGRLVLPPHLRSTPRLQTHSTTPAQPAPREQRQPPAIRPQDVQRFMEALLPPPGAAPHGVAPQGVRSQVAPRRTVPARSAPARTTTAPPQHVALTGDEFAEISPQRQRRLLLIAVLSLEEDLETMRGGDGWRRHLATGPLQSAIACDSSGTPSAATRQRLQEIAKRFEETAGNADYRGLTGSWEFQTLRIGLPEYATDPIERQKERVADGIDRLRRSLDRTKEGPGWNEYLKLDELQSIALSSKKLTPADRDVLKKVDERIKKVDEDAKYRTVAGMTGFSATRDALGELTRLSEDKPEPTAAEGVLTLADSDSAAGSKRLADPNSAQEVKQLADPNLAREIKRLVESDSAAGSKRMADPNSAQRVVRLVDRQTIREKVEGLMADAEESERRRVQEIFERMFGDETEDGDPVYTLISPTDDVKRPERRLFQFEDVPAEEDDPDEEVRLLQFEDVPAEEDDSKADDKN